MKLDLRSVLLAVVAAIILAGCAAQKASLARGETMPTEAVPMGVASALFPDPDWK